MTRLSFPPGPSFLEQAATATWYFLEHCGPAASAAHVVVPTAAQIPGVRQALDAAARAAGQPRLLPRVLTLGHWLLDLPPDLDAEPAPARSHAARLLAVQQAIRAQDWLRSAFGAQTEGAAWGLAQTLLSISDELSARWLEDAAIREDDDIDGDDRAALLQGALERTYAHLSERFLGQEAQIVLAFWQMLSGPDDPLPARRRALQRLAQQVAGPVVWIGPTPPEPIEANFLQQAGELVPTLEVGYDWTGGEAPADAGWYETLLALWPEARRAGQEAGEDQEDQEDLEDQEDHDGAIDAAGVRPSTPMPALPQTLPAHRPRVRVIGSARFEDEAAAAAAQLVQWLNEGRKHVALAARVVDSFQPVSSRTGAPARVSNARVRRATTRSCATRATCLRPSLSHWPS